MSKGHIKTNEEIVIMKKGGKILGEVLSEVLSKIKPGVSELELDSLAERLIREKGGAPGFKKVPGYKHTLCTSVNDVVVHGIPGSRKLKEGDVVGIDCGVFYEGYNTDMGETVKVQSSTRSASFGNSQGKSSGQELNPSTPLRTRVKSLEGDKVDKFLKTGKEAMWAGIRQARDGNRVGDISKAIQEVIEKVSYSVVRSLVGHGVGRELHEEPEIPGYLAARIDKTQLLEEGMTIAIEAIYNMGGDEVVYKRDDGWTISTADGSLSGMFERTILVTKREPVLLTPDLKFH